MANLLIQFFFLLALPAIYAGVTASIASPHLERPWLFFVLAAVALYLLYVLVFYFAAPTAISMDLFEKTDPAHPVTPIEMGSEPFSPLAAYLQPIVIFSAIALPALWFFANYFRR